MVSIYSNRAWDFSPCDVVMTFVHMVGETPTLAVNNPHLICTGKSGEKGNSYNDLDDPDLTLHSGDVIKPTWLIVGS